MTDTVAFEPGGYRFMPGVFQYSGGVIADGGHEIVRVRFRRPVPLEDGFRRVEDLLEREGRPTTAVCAFELRSPGQFSEAGFRAFNELYVETLGRWGIWDGTTNPVARSNVCPEIGGPETPSVHAVAFTVPRRAGSEAPSFAVAGSGEVPEGRSNYRDHIVRRGDTSPDGLEEKVRFVMGEMTRRLTALGVGWADVTATQAYTVHDIHPFLGPEIVTKGATPGGLTWFYDRPPIVELDYEMDCRGIADERVA